MQKESYEIVGEKDEAVGRLIASLPRVEAPSDFEMRVRARIASGRSAGPSWLTPLVRVAVPAALLLTIGGYFAYYSFYQEPSTTVVEVINASSPVAAPGPGDQQPQVPGESQELTAESSQTPSSEQIENSGRTIPKTTNPSTERPEGGSYDIGGGDGRAAPILPRGLNANERRVGNIDDSVSTSGISVKSFFEAIGVSARYSSGWWKVRSVTAASMAERAGVKAGDVLEALNDQKLTEKTSLGRTFTATTLRVRRDGESIKLDLKP